MSLSVCQVLCWALDLFSDVMLSGVSLHYFLLGVKQTFKGILLVGFQDCSSRSAVMGIVAPQTPLLCENHICSHAYASSGRICI